MGGAVAVLGADALRARKGGPRLAVLTAYDYPTARALDLAGLDLILVGDTLGMVELGHPTTHLVTLEMMLHHVRAVRAGVSRTHLVADLPKDTYLTPEQAVETSRTLVEAGADSVKMEGPLVPQVEAVIAAGIPAMGHVGLLPQTADGYRRRGSTPGEAEEIAAGAVALDRAGCYAIVIEAVAAELATRITGLVSCPTIGIAAGQECDGQVLVSTDLLGFLPEWPAFVTPVADLHGVVREAGRDFAALVRGGASLPVEAPAA